MNGNRARPGLRDVVGWIDRGVSHLAGPFERPSLVPLLFHSIFEDEREIERDAVYPQEAVTTTSLRLLIEDFLARGYRFVTAESVVSGLDASPACVWLTFDDGYANNLRLPEILREYAVPATLFVTTGHIESGRRFWWDAVWAERRRRGQRGQQIDAEIAMLEGWSLDDVDAYVERELGVDVDRPRSDLDRSITRDELRTLARTDGVEVGNHSVDHPIFALLASEEIEAQLRAAQDYLHELTGTTPLSMSYPNGVFDRRVVDATRAAGLAVGVTAVPRKNRLPIDPSSMLELGRYQLRPGKSVKAQTRVIRSELQLGNAARRLRSWARRADVGSSAPGGAQ